MDDGDLLISFLGPPGMNRAELPRVGRWSALEAPERVALSPTAQRMLTHLAVPSFRLGLDAAHPSAADRFAGTLARPLPRRSTAANARALGLSRTSEFRHRQQLMRELGAQGLGDRLESGPGWIEPHGVTSDIAELVGLVRDGDWAGATRLLTVLGEGDPRSVQWLMTEPWPPATGEHVRSALGLAKRHLTSAPAIPLDDPPEITDDDGLGRSLQLAQRALPWRARPFDAAVARRQRVRAVAGALAVLALAGTTAWLVLPGRDQDVLKLAWPRSERPQPAYLANLTKDVGLNEYVPATAGDQLLLRTRIAPAPVTRRKMWMQSGMNASDGRATGLWVHVPGLTEVRSASVGARTGSATLRPRLVPGSTVLRTADGRFVRRLPDLRQDGVAITLGTLKARRAYLIDTLLTVEEVRPADRGQIADGQRLDCTAPAQTGTVSRGRRRLSISSNRVYVGTTLTCEAYIMNWGPRTLEAVTARFVPAERGSDEWAAIQVWSGTTDGSPRGTWLTTGVPVQGALGPLAKLVPDSVTVKEVSKPFMRPNQVSGFLSGIDLGELRPGGDHALRLRFRVRIG